MQVQEALDFLRSHQPLPDHPTDSIRERFSEALFAIRQQPLPEAIPLLIGSCANWHEDGDFEHVLYLVSLYPPDQVREHLHQGLKSPHSAVRHWSAVLAARFPSPAFLPELEAILKEDLDVQRMVAAHAIECIQTPESRQLAAQYLRNETSEDVIEILEAASEQVNKWSR